MFFEISHASSYRYSEPVFLEPQMLRLRPRSDVAQRLERFVLTIEPEPTGVSEGTDAWGNPAAWVWFDGLHEELTITSDFLVETLRTNPFDYVLPSAALRRVPVPYGRERPALDAYLQPAAVGEEVRGLTEAVVRDASGDLHAFLMGLTQRLYESVEVIIRDEGDPLPAAATLADGRGSCRDLVVVFMDCCRQAGVAARFVSGHQEGDPDQDERHLHAWAEAYVPGGGWRGYDPTQGLAVADRHIALAAAGVSEGAAPTEGTFRRTGATSHLEATIHLRATEDRPR